MDQTLNLKIKEYKRALRSLNKALKEPSSDLVRDSVIKRFEYTYEICWKTMKRFLQDGNITTRYCLSATYML